jgi:SAM-dependent methyltransferase
MSSSDSLPFRVHLPDVDESVSQDEAWCDVELEGEVRRRIRFHDYGALYEVPGLYEHLFYERLKCNSPATVCELLGAELRSAHVDPGRLTVLDVGAGNGMVGEILADMGAGSLLGIDIIPEAEQAARRDRPNVYDDYLVCDLTDLASEDRGVLADHDLNCLVTVAALGFGDIPPVAFAEAFNAISSPGWVAFNIKTEFFDEADDGTGFSGLIHRMIDEGVLQPRAHTRYQHRLSVCGNPLYYVAMVGTKTGDVPLHWAREAQQSELDLA